MPAENSNNRNHAAATRWIYDPKVRGILFQAIAVACVAWMLFYFVSNALHNMETRGIATGFGFLDNRASFGIVQTLISYSEDDTYGRAFIIGLLNTLLVSGIGIIFATLLGFLIGIARLSNNWLLSRAAAVYIETFRNIPLLLQVFFWYFCVLRALPPPRQSLGFADAFFLNVRGLFVPAPVTEDGFFLVTTAFVMGLAGVVILKKWAKKRQELTGQTFPVFFSSLGLLLGLPLIVFLIAGMPLHWELPALKGFNFRGGLTIIPELFSMVVALTIFTAASIAEIVRSGIMAVSKGQVEAASALGLKNGLTLRFVIIPQAMRVIIPPLTSQYLNLVKNSSLATAVGYPDLVSVFMGSTLNQTGQAVEIIAMTMAVYLTISLITSVLMNIYNAKKALVER
ncbi:amino acid ABC transporter permease [Tolumonas osonensis]|uniref:General L-amino acid transport system permease protein n=1 Tax=Tolumonas osonensis TaxID=675874 RepID=A0A841GMY5_9GAMM|nr:amino acid ABC transporter permease [Tolumonas osonensis]MBB6055832.1 general L-amino acid transport system permease protein [Tolumonas osonensis]